MKLLNNFSSFAISVYEWKILQMIYGCHDLFYSYICIIDTKVSKSLCHLNIISSLINFVSLFCKSFPLLNSSLQSALFEIFMQKIRKFNIFWRYFYEDFLCLKFWAGLFYLFMSCVPQKSNFIEESYYRYYSLSVNWK